MEILSIGEKIKRTRVYQGITLKQLCSNKISISKMSCIENDKIKVNDDILAYIAKKLGVDYEYLAQDVHEQISENLRLIKSNNILDEDLENVIRHNLNYAMNYSYHDLAFELMHKLIKYYIKSEHIEQIQSIIPQYYELYNKNSTDENTIIYYRDLADFFYSVGEDEEAMGYYRRIRELLQKKEILEKEEYAYSCLKESIYYKEKNEISTAYEVLMEGAKYIDSISNEIKKGEIYNNLALLNIMLGDLDRADEFISAFNECLVNHHKELAIAKRGISEAYFYIKCNNKALEEMERSTEVFPKKDMNRRVEFLNSCLKILYKNEQYDLAYKVSDVVLDMAIRLDDLKLIEEGYYYKSMLLQKKGMYFQAEMYMNLSLDSLFKLEDDGEKRRGRYLDTAEMYYKLGEKRDALKYYNLAIKAEEDI